MKTRKIGSSSWMLTHFKTVNLYLVSMQDAAAALGNRGFFLVHGKVHTGQRS